MPLTPFKTNATEADRLAAPEGMRAELIDGNLYLQPRPRGSHAQALGELSAELRPARRLGGWVILPEVDIQLPGENKLSPDITGWRAEQFTEPLSSAFFTVIPAWVCEVLSPGTRSYDLGLKRQKYLRAGIPHLWVVDPDARMVETFEAHQGAWWLTGTYADADQFLSEPFPAVNIALSTFWTVGPVGPVSNGGSK